MTTSPGLALTISPDVRDRARNARVDLESTARLYLAGDGLCTLCRKPLGTTGGSGPVHVSILAGAQGTSDDTIAFTHQRCLTSKVYPHQPDAGSAPGAGELMDIAGWLIQHGDNLIPCLVCAMTEHTYDPLLLPTLRARGFGKVRQPGKLIPLPVEGWQVNAQLSSPAHVQIVAGELTFFIGNATLSGKWKFEAERLGWCIVYIGVLNLDGADETALFAAAAAGDLIGARMPLRQIPT